MLTYSQAVVQSALLKTGGEIDIHLSKLLPARLFSLARWRYSIYSTEGIKVWMYTGYVRRLFIENLMQKVLFSYLGVFKSLRPSQPDGSRCLIQTTPEEVVLRICDYLLTERDGSHAPLTYSMTEFQPTICAMSRVQRANNPRNFI